MSWCLWLVLCWLVRIFVCIDFGDDKDCVLICKDGVVIYFVVDVVYYLSKKDCGFDEKVYMFGVDYYGYVGRLKVIVVCVGDDFEYNIEVLIG